MTRASVLNGIAKLIPHRVLVRPSIQVVQGRLAAADKLRRTTVGPGMPIVGEVILDAAADWRAQFAAALWTLMQEYDAAANRNLWMICVGTPPVTLDELYAIAVQADPLVQLHLFADADEAAAFRVRYVPPASWREGSGRVVHGVGEVLSRIQSRQSVFTRATASRASAHTLIKQIAGEGLVLAVHNTQARAIEAHIENHMAAAGVARLVFVGDAAHVPEGLVQDPRVIVARRAGASLLDELAIVRYCDGYLGRADHYAIVAADAGVSCLLSEPPAVSSHPSSHVWMTADAATQFGRWLERLGGRQIKTTPARTGV
jgi:hypothetical protein